LLLYTTMTSLISQLRAYKDYCGLSITKIAERTGQSKPQLSRIFNPSNDAGLHVSTLEVIADAMDTAILIVPRNKVAAIQMILDADGDLLAIRETPSALDSTLNITLGAKQGTP
jgi:transcriptional regulator with XRE-family HTH domain